MFGCNIVLNKNSWISEKDIIKVHEQLIQKSPFVDGQDNVKLVNFHYSSFNFLHNEQEEFNFNFIQITITIEHT